MPFTYGDLKEKLAVFSEEQLNCRVSVFVNGEVYESWVPIVELVVPQDSPTAEEINQPHFIVNGE